MDVCCSMAVAGPFLMKLLAEVVAAAVAAPYYYYDAVVAWGKGKGKGNDMRKTRKIKGGSSLNPTKSLVEKGGTVAFENRSTTTHYVASLQSLHISHSISQGIEPGQCGTVHTVFASNFTVKMNEGRQSSQILAYTLPQSFLH